MPFLVLFSPPKPRAESSLTSLSAEVLQEHDAYVRSLQDEGHIHSRRSQSAGLSGPDDKNGFSGYILRCFNREEAEALVQKDPLSGGNNVQVIPWDLSVSDDHANEDEDLPKLGFDPILPVTDMQRSLVHYRSLGFKPQGYDNEHGFATLPGLGCIHLTLQSDHDRKINAHATYLYVEDAGALAAKWKRECPGGDTREVVDTEYGLREGAHLDPDNCLIRFGSKMVRRGEFAV